MEGTPDLLEPAIDALLPLVPQVEITPVRGEGVWLVGADDRYYLDFYGGHAVSILGHGHPRLLAALEAQAHRLMFQSTLFPSELRRRAAERLVAFAPAPLERVFFVNSGAEANENALRLAFLATGRTEVVAVEGGFHGRTAAAGAVTSGSERWYAFPQRPFGINTVPFDDLAALRAAIGPKTAAVIVEPVQGVAGARALSPEFLQAARACASAQGALLILDEVQTGMGRTGFPFAAQAYGIEPDLLTTAKGLGGGFPAGAVLASRAVAADLRSGDLGSTFGGAPLACALVEAVIETIERDRLLPRVQRLSARIRRECCVGPVVAIQGLGFLLGLVTRRPAREILAELRARNILAGSSADPHVVRLLPPIVLEDSHVDLLRDALEEIPA